jgi:hypothetical protein
LEPEKRNVQRSPGSPLSLPNWIHKGRVRQLRSYCLQNLALEAETFLTHSEVVWGVQDSVDFIRGQPHNHLPTKAEKCSKWAENLTTGSSKYSKNLSFY